MGELYLYCLRENPEGTSTISAKGIDGMGEVFIIPYQKLEAIASNSSEGFASEEIQKKAQEDVNWIREKALAHEVVIEEAMSKGNKALGLIPMRFGTIFKDRMSLENALNRDYPMIREVLERIHGKQEWSAKVYLKSKELFEQRIKEIEQFNYSQDKIRVIFGLEVNINVDSTLQIPNEILERHELILVSIHTSFRQEKDLMTRRIIKALENPNVDIFAHPTGRLLLEREGIEADWEQIFKVAAKQVHCSK